MRSDADMLEVGCPDPALVLARMPSTRSCLPSSPTRARSELAVTRSEVFPVTDISVLRDRPPPDCPRASGVHVSPAHDGCSGHFHARAAAVVVRVVLGGARGGREPHPPGGPASPSPAPEQPCV